MATILLSAAGAAVGAGFGGTVLGLSGAVIGRAVGATLGRVIDQRLMGSGSEAVETGRIERFRLTGASEGAPVSQVLGRVRIAGQIIWSTRFLEDVNRTGGGKGAPKPRVSSFSYSVSFAVALCQGRITSVGRIWADGVEIASDTLNLRVYSGAEDQLPDPKIEAVEGAGMAPAYRGIAYVVIEDLDLARFGNRVPQLTFEVVRPAQGELADQSSNLERAVRAVALMPGTGEYALATTPLTYTDGPGLGRSINVNSPTGVTDFAASLRQLGAELPNVGSVSLIVSWFGSDLRCSECTIEPKVEQKLQDPVGMPWRAGGIARAQASEIVQEAGRPIYGGTPADGSVMQAIAALRDEGHEVMFYPFILMDQLEGNGRTDPWTGAEDQPALPWRGRITMSAAPGRNGTPDRSAAAQAEVDAFFGTSQPGDFVTAGGQVVYSGPAEWRYRRFILHYAHLCALAGGVDAFCIGSEMRGLTQIRGDGDSFPAVAAMRVLAAEVRAILGPATKISYAADWTEYFGYSADDNLYFHLDPLWADTNVDFVGIDNYMPISDWRDTADHADSHWGSIYNLDYLKANIIGGEGFDWFYDSPEGAEAQRRMPIEDGAYGEPWVYRNKDLKSWWSNPHHNRLAGVRDEISTAWVPQSKPIRFTEYGCAAIDKGANEPNKFLDPKSSESGLPKYSNGRRDDTIQMQYLRAMAEVWADPANNPVAATYGEQMLDMARSHVWAWDARPFPFFPNATSLWSDGENYARGHWLTGRATNQPLDAVVAEICERSAVTDIDVSELYGVVRGYLPEGIETARSALQPLMLTYGFEAVERDGILHFQMRGKSKPVLVDRGVLVASGSSEGTFETLRAPDAETAGRVRLSFIEHGGDFSIRQVEAIFPDEVSYGVAHNEVSLSLTTGEGRGTVERWLAEARVAKDTARFVLPRSLARLGAGDVVEIDGAHYRIDRMEQSESSLAEAVRTEPSIYVPPDSADDRVVPRAFVAPTQVFALFLDLPLINGDEVPHAPHVAATALPWPGAVAVWDSSAEDGFELNTLVPSPSVIGITQTSLLAAQAGLWDRGEALRVKLTNGTLSSASELAVLNGANALAIGDGSSDNWEVFQFRDAALVAPQTYDLGLRLRGQLGTNGIMPAEWPVGSLVVLLNRSPIQLDLPSSVRGLARNYRIGVAARGTDDPHIVERSDAFRGIGLRPYAPAHLKILALANGDLAFTWIRRTRIDGDTWDSVEVPLAEERELYTVRLIANDAVLREETVPQAHWAYTTTMQAADAISGTYRLEVAQVSDRFGAGPFAVWNAGA